VLATTKLPIAIDFLLGELRHEGVLGPAMSLLPHYFTPFQAFVVQESENDRLRFDLRIGLEILRREATYRAGEPTQQGVFLYQFESLCRHRLGYDRGLEAIAGVWAYSVLTSVRGLSMAHAGLGVSLYWTGLTVGRILFGFVVDRTSLAPLLRGALLLVVVGAGLVCSSVSPYSAVLGFALLGLGAGPIFPSFMADTPRRVGESHTTNAIGFQVAAAALGQASLPALVGYLARAHGLAVVAPSMLTAALVVLVLHEAMTAASRIGRTVTSR